jgi:hypothetical protein
MIADPDDERSFLEETARWHLAGGRRPSSERVPLSLLTEEPDAGAPSDGWWVARGPELELHPATIADLEALAS